MKKYMVIIVDDQGEQFAEFFNTYKEAENCRMNSECGMGWQASVYCYMRFNECDDFEPESYYEI